MNSQNEETKECGLEDKNAGDIESEHPLVDLRCHGIPRDRCPTCGNTVSVLSWASKCICD